MGTKNAEFHAYFKSVEKVIKKIPHIKVISKNVTEICTYVSQTCFTFWCFFKIHYNGFEIRMKFCV